METLTVSPETKNLKSFDLLANVEAMQLDLERFGYVLPETRAQVTNEQLSFLVEGAERDARTPFVLARNSKNDLTYFDDGDWRPYGSMVLAGRDAARQDALVDPRRQFLVDWSDKDYYHYLQMRRLEPGQKHSWSSSYPHDEHAKYGAQFMSECGLQPDRKMGFLYQATCQANGSVLLESQTIDLSDQEAIAAAVDLSSGTEASLDDMVAVHDQVLSEKFGGRFYAGRRDQEKSQNAWNELLASNDLIKYLMNGLEKIARSDLPRVLAEDQTKRNIYGVWALFKKRLDGTAGPTQASGPEFNGINLMPPEVFLARQVDSAFREFALSGKVMAGCGGAVSFKIGENDVMNADSSDVFNSIFSGEASSDKFGSLHFDCPHCHKDNTRPRGRLLKSCQHCHKDVQCK